MHSARRPPPQIESSPVALASRSARTSNEITAQTTALTHVRTPRRHRRGRPPNSDCASMHPNQKPMVMNNARRPRTRCRARRPSRTPALHTTDHAASAPPLQASRRWRSPLTRCGTRLQNRGRFPIISARRRALGQAHEWPPRRPPDSSFSAKCRPQTSTAAPRRRRLAAAWRRSRGSGPRRRMQNAEVHRRYGERSRRRCTLSSSPCRALMHGHAKILLAGGGRPATRTHATWRPR